MLSKADLAAVAERDLSPYFEGGVSVRSSGLDVFAKSHCFSVSTRCGSTEFRLSDESLQLFLSGARALPAERLSEALKKQLEHRKD